MFDSIQGCNDLIKSLVTATGSYQDAMFLYLTILMSENVDIGVYTQSSGNLQNRIAKFTNIVGILKPNTEGVVEILIVNQHKIHCDYPDNDLTISAYQKNENGEWRILRKNEISVPPSKEMIWKKY